MTIKKIVITGGPCGGKSTALAWIKNAFSKQGYTVLFASETATDLITGGVAPWTCGTNAEYQCCQLSLQLEKERVFLRAAKSMPKDKILIVCDRGSLDNKAYMTAEEWDSVLKEKGLTEDEMLLDYEAVFHLVTAAKGAAECYTTANNSARKETVEQAAALDDKVIAAWENHPYFRIIDNSTDFQDKMQRLVDEIAKFLNR